MTTVTEPTLFDQPTAAPVDADTAALLDTIAGDPIHRDDRALVIDAVKRAAREHEGLVNPNHWRPLLEDDRGNTIPYPKVVGATIAALKAAGRLVEAGWVVTEGSRSKNNGKQARAYRWVGPL